MNRSLRVILGANAAALPTLISSGPRVFARACGRAFNAARAVPREPHGFPEVELASIVGDRRPMIRLVIQRYESGMLPADDVRALLAVLVAEQPREVLEIGTFMGHTTRLMAENLEHGTIHTVDLPEGFDAGTDPATMLPKDDFHLIRDRIVGREYKDHACRDRIRQHFADTATWDFREAGAPTFFFIDGAHTYEYCKSDSEKCYALGSGPAVFLWHDCDVHHPGVVRFLEEWRGLGRNIERISGTALAYWKREGKLA